MCIRDSKCGDCQRDALHWQQDEGVHFDVSPEPGHDRFVKLIDVGLDKKVGKGDQALLEPGGHAQQHDPFNHGKVKAQLPGIQGEILLGAQQDQQHQDGGNDLRDQGSPCLLYTSRCV